MASACVMDASSCFGTRLVKCLLDRGYIVHAALQNYGESLFLNELECDDDDKMKKLKIFQSDLFNYHSIVDALKGCSALFYSFEPPSDHSNYDEFIVEVEMKAAHNVLEACAQTDTIEKVVFTSSATAIIWGHENDQNSPSMDNLDERHWSDINFCRKFKLWHALSKTLAEKTAWALAMDRGVNMVSINAGLLMTPDLTITNPYLKGAAEMYEDGVLVTVDLDFLVEAHICVYEEISTYGRYLCFNHIINQTEDAIKLANMVSPSPSSPQRCFIQNLLYTWHLRNSPNGTPIDPRVSANEQGLDPSIIKSFPTFTYSSVKDYRKEKYGLECAICLVEFEDDSLLRLITSCNHVYHQDCIDLWLESHKTCPVCRTSLDSPEALQKRLLNNNGMRDINEDEPLEDSLSIVIQSDDNDSHKEESGQHDENSKWVSATLERVELQNIVAKFSRSHSTGHSIDRARGAEDRFTLKLPEHVRAKIIKGHNSTKSCTTFGEYKSKTTTGNGGFGEVSESCNVDIDKV
ncbi:hypothetical protein RND71_012551 [Anisodus tanguticus]|uniref:RING-type E3 ubiquitin transferase n=1 Tax=Anisodus tanguticus TaxID=243964 RepID=A0AAE1SDH4_9SOLA|nr:hypothetical protein RND71_012551 [Anisodus tanguticus]